MNARKIFWLTLSGLIIFLTGCAPKGYHKVSSLTEVTAPSESLAGRPLFGWPVIGRVTVPFGAKENGAAIKGIVIEPAEDGLVKAAADGRVSFIDEKWVGYGKTVIMEHAGGFSTVYARNAQILVTVGQALHRGEALAKVGPATSGSLQGIYFEIRKNIRAEDPLNYLPK